MKTSLIFINIQDSEERKWFSTESPQMRRIEHLGPFDHVRLAFGFSLMFTILSRSFPLTWKELDPEFSWVILLIGKILEPWLTPLILTHLRHSHNSTHEHVPRFIIPKSSSFFKIKSNSSPWGNRLVRRIVVNFDIHQISNLSVFFSSRFILNSRLISPNFNPSTRYSYLKPKTLST